MAKKPVKLGRTIRFDAETIKNIESIATAKEMTFSNAVRVACELYVARVELAEELDGVEERLAASILRTQKESAKVSEDVQLLIALFDQLAQFLFITTPEVVDREAAGAIGQRRHKAFIDSLHSAFSTNRKKAVIAENMEKANEAS